MTRNSAAGLDVDRIDLLEKREVLLGDFVDRDVGDLNFRPANKKEQEIQRPLEGVERDVIVFLKVHGMLRADDRETLVVLQYHHHSSKYGTNLS